MCRKAFSPEEFAANLRLILDQWTICFGVMPSCWALRARNQCLKKLGPEGKGETGWLWLGRFNEPAGKFATNSVN